MISFLISPFNRTIIGRICDDCLTLKNRITLDESPEQGGPMGTMFRPQRSIPIKPVRQVPLPVVQRNPVQPPLRSDTIQRAQGNPGSLMPSDVQSLQRTMGNQAVARMVGQGSAAPVVQAKLRVGANNDPYEQEANRVAQQVVG